MKKFIVVLSMWYLVIQDHTAGPFTQVTYGPYKSRATCMYDANQVDSGVRMGLYTKSHCYDDADLARKQYLLKLTEPLEQHYRDRLNEHIERNR